MCFIGVLIHKLKNNHSNQQTIYVFIKISPSKDNVKNCSLKKDIIMIHYH